MFVDFNLGFAMLTSNEVEDVIVRQISKVGITEIGRIKKPSYKCKFQLA